MVRGGAPSTVYRSSIERARDRPGAEPDAAHTCGPVQASLAWPRALFPTGNLPSLYATPEVIELGVLTPHPVGNPKPLELWGRRRICTQENYSCPGGHATRPDPPREAIWSLCRPTNYGFTNGAALPPPNTLTAGGDSSSQTTTPGGQANPRNCSPSPRPSVPRAKAQGPRG